MCNLTVPPPDGMLLAAHGALLLETDRSGDLQIVRRLRASLAPAVTWTRTPARIATAIPAFHEQNVI